MSKIPKDIKDLLFYIELQQEQAQTNKKFFKDGSQNYKEPMIVIAENRFNELSQFYEKYYKMVMAIKNDKSINALCEMQGGTYAN